jgi:hypothetical protein
MEPPVPVPVPPVPPLVAPPVVLDEPPVSVAAPPPDPGSAVQPHTTPTTASITDEANPEFFGLIEYIRLLVRLARATG